MPHSDRGASRDIPAQATELQAAIQKADLSNRMGYEAKDIVIAINCVSMDTFEQYKH